MQARFFDVRPQMSSDDQQTKYPLRSTYSLSAVAQSIWACSVLSTDCKLLAVSRSTTFLKRQKRGCGSGLWSPRLHFSSVQSDGAGVYPSMQWGSLDRLPVHHRVKRQTDAALHTDGRVSDHRENSWETSRKWSWNTSCCDSPRYVSDTTHHVLMRSVHSAGLNSWSLYQEKIIKR